MSYEPGRRSPNPYLDALLRINDRKLAAFGPERMKFTEELGDGVATYNNDGMRKLLSGLDLDVKLLDEFGGVIVENVMAGLVALGVRFDDEDQAFTVGLLIKATAVDPFTAAILYERQRSGAA